MLPKLTPRKNHYGSDVSAGVPASAPGLPVLRPEHHAIWERARGFLRVRSNDAHTLYAYGLATAIGEATAGCDLAVALPAILLHDTGWSQVPEDLVLRAISPTGGDPELVRWHEREGVRIAREILTDTGTAAVVVDEVCAIIAAHDSSREAASVNDAVVKDADKLWRLSPHGIDTVMEWFGLDRAATARLCASRVHGALHTDAARAMAFGFGALAAIDVLPERIELG